MKELQRSGRDFVCVCFLARPKGACAPSRRRINGSASGASLFSIELTSDRVYLCACILPRDLLFCAPEGRIAPIGASYPESIILSRIGDFIPKR